MKKFLILTVMLFVAFAINSQTYELVTSLNPSNDYNENIIWVDTYNGRVTPFYWNYNASEYQLWGTSFPNYAGARPAPERYRMLTTQKKEGKYIYITNVIWFDTYTGDPQAYYWNSKNKRFELWSAYFPDFPDPKRSNSKRYELQVDFNPESGYIINVFWIDTVTGDARAFYWNNDSSKFEPWLLDFPSIGY
ncbi:MAG TPA: hypothetical protein PLG34_07595 [Spirochaetota bacterium]|nr:MAG: hypothetical protein BWX91_02280 [Spirochaetes bacterium ADurb.Bin133]HNZ27079.1 hypothetical protein [Spirochaetota bacterium]HPY87831.1 hypothetical protein [Spirochaetota bacterium]